MDIDSLLDMKRPQLQKLCKQHNLKASGKNEELRQRIADFFSLTLPTGRAEEEQPAVVEGDESAEVVQPDLPSTTDDAIPPATQFETTTTSNIENIIEQNITTVNPDEDTKVTTQPQVEEVTKSVESISLKSPVKTLESTRIRSRTEVSSTATSAVLQRGKSLSREDKPSSSSVIRSNITKTFLPVRKEGKWEDIHTKQFSKMGSILDHYAARRNSLKGKKPASSSKETKPVAAVEPAEQRVRTPSIASQKTEKSVNRLQRMWSNGKQKLRRSIGLDSKIDPIPKQEKTVKFAQSSLPSDKVAGPAKAPSIKSVGSTKKFDLKASLAKPLSYIPHRGPLKPFQEKTAVPK